MEAKVGKAHCEPVMNARPVGVGKTTTTFPHASWNLVLLGEEMLMFQFILLFHGLWHAISIQCYQLGYSIKDQLNMMNHNHELAIMSIIISKQ